MVSSKSYSQLRTVEEEERLDEDLDLGPVKTGRRFKKSPGIRYDLFNSYDIASQGESRYFGEDGLCGRNGPKKSHCYAFSMGIVLVTLIISAVVYISSASSPNVLEPLKKDSTPARSTGKPGISIEDVLAGKFYAKGFNGTWISDTEIKYFGRDGDLLLFDVVSKTTSVIITGQDISANLEGKSLIKWSLSADRNFVLLSYDAQNIFRYSTYAKYVIYDIKTRHFQPLFPPVLTKNHELLQLAEWSPSKNAIVFIYANNIFYKASALDNETIQITTDGSRVVYNGVTDWVYEEEVFNAESAIWFSPDGSHLAFVSFNDTRVDEMHFEIYGEPGSREFQYPMIESIPYPKAGRTNPTAEVSMVALRELGKGPKVFLKKDLQFPEVPQEHYIYAVVWASNFETLVVTMNRHQNDSRHHICNMSGLCQTILTDVQKGGWIDVESPKVSSDGKSFLTLTSQYQGEKWYRHILLYTRDTITKPITSGDFSVDAILKWDEARNRIYFLAPNYDRKTKKLVPSASHLYYVDDSGKDTAGVTCVTCNTFNSFREPCDFNSAKISERMSYFVQSCSGPGVPESFLKSLTSPNLTFIWSANTQVRELVEKVSHPIVQNFDIPIENNFVLKAQIHIPPNFDKNKKYPLLVEVYGGPNSQKIKDRYLVDWSKTLITRKDVIYAYIDGRGSGRQSDDLKFQVYRRLGTVEIHDQIYGAAWLTANVPFIDANRTAIWGWSYGGFATAMTLAKDTKGVFKCGISVAPVTNWALYDTIYTERYMGLPLLRDNFAGYRKSDISNHVENFRNKKFYLVHGTADDNVHYQQSMILSRALEKADILFRQTSYPDESHGLGSVRRHLYHTLEDFLFTQCF